jgi:hypothetical protein
LHIFTPNFEASTPFFSAATHFHDKRKLHEIKLNEHSSFCSVGARQESSERNPKKPSNFPW